MADKIAIVIMIIGLCFGALFLPASGTVVFGQGEEAASITGFPTEIDPSSSASGGAFPDNGAIWPSPSDRYLPITGDQTSSFPLWQQTIHYAPPQYRPPFIYYHSPAYPFQTNILRK